MLVKIKDGTRSGQSLCRTCRFAHNIRGASDSQELTKCSALERQVPFSVVECNKYENKATPGLWDMKEIAWVLSTDKQKKFGFQSPKDWCKNRQDDDDMLATYNVPRGLPGF